MLILSPSEAACLRRISEGPTVLDTCRSDVLEKLMQMGLVEHAPGLHAPLTSAHAAYRLTERGWRILNP